MAADGSKNNEPSTCALPLLSTAPNTSSDDHSYHNHVNYAYMWMDKANANKKRQLLIESNLSGTSNIVIIITFLLFAHVHFEIYQ